MGLGLGLGQGQGQGQGGNDVVELSLSTRYSQKHRLLILCISFFFSSYFLF